MSGEEICTIINKHVAECGEPPQFEFNDFTYVSYFENVHGEQSLFLYDSNDNEVIVYIADASWDNPQVLPGQWILDNTLPSSDADVGILPDSSERAWLKACKSAVKPRIAQNMSDDSR